MNNRRIFLAILITQLVIIGVLIEESNVILDSQYPKEKINPGPGIAETKDGIHFNYREIEPNRSETWDKNNNYFEKTIVQSNEHGIRDYRNKYQKTPANNTFRIAAVGDSHTFGYRVNLSQTWVKQLENELNSSSTEKEVEVLNFGYYGYSSTDKVAITREKVIEFDPDLIIFQLSGNDPRNHTRIRKLKEGYLNETSNPDKGYRQEARGKAYEKVRDNPPTSEEMREIFEKDLNELHSITSRKNIELIFLDYSLHEAQSRKIRELSSRYNRKLTELPENYRSDEYRIDDDGHATPKGNTLIAQYISEELKEVIR